MDPSTTPAMPPPPGVTSDFDRWTTQQSILIAVYSVTFGLATILLIIRIYTVLRILKRFGLDDGTTSNSKIMATFIEAKHSDRNNTRRSWEAHVECDSGGLPIVYTRGLLLSSLPLNIVMANKKLDSWVQEWAWAS
ncbi:hypothetical protein BGZ63DRAFT_408258 [Mariannaea sp. PMI_226]|nr:hypothetical protein BGZ63DRAFT_408258 [Mariannaea sp. PMI_226]